MCIRDRSTGGTAAGLAVGASLAPADLRIEVVAVHGPADETEAAVAQLAEATADLLGAPAPDAGQRSVHDEHLGTGYGIETAASREALELLARTEGVVLDPVYTAKAFAHLLATLPEREGDHVVLLHTGGQPGVFAYG